MTRQGGRYVVDPDTGETRLVQRTGHAPEPQPDENPAPAEREDLHNADQE